MRIILAMALVLGFADTADAADCAAPKLLNSVAMTPLDDGGMMVVTASVDGAPRRFLIGTGDIFSQVARTPAAGLHLVGLETFKGQFDVAGRFSNQVARVGDLTMGDMQATGFYTRISPDPDFTARPPFDGIIATDMMAHYDIDLDFANRTMNYFAPEQCRGAGVYWAPKNLAVLPMQNRPGRPVVPVMLDGRRIWALLDTGSEHTMLNPVMARKLFGLGPDSADMTPVEVVSDGVTAKAYRHGFSRLSLGGVVIDNPALAIVADATTASDREIYISRTQPNRFALSRLLPDMIIGMDVLSQTHLYISLENQRVYVSPAGDGTRLAQTVSAPSKLTVWPFGYEWHVPFVRF